MCYDKYQPGSEINIFLYNLYIDFGASGEKGYTFQHLRLFRNEMGLTAWGIEQSESDGLLIRAPFFEYGPSPNPKPEHVDSTCSVY